MILVTISVLLVSELINTNVLAVKLDSSNCKKKKPASNNVQKDLSDNKANAYVVAQNVEPVQEKSILVLNVTKGISKMLTLLIF